MKRAFWFLLVLLPLAYLAECGLNTGVPYEPRPPVLVAVDPAVVSGDIDHFGLVERTYDVGPVVATAWPVTVRPVGRGMPLGDGRFSFRLSAVAARRWALRLHNYLPDACRHLASNLDARTVSAGLYLTLTNKLTGASVVPVVQASDSGALYQNTDPYYTEVNVFNPHYLVDSTVGGYLVFRTYADRELRVWGECEGWPMYRFRLALKRGWNAVVVTREAESVIGVKTLSGLPQDSEWVTRLRWDGNRLR